MSGKNNRNGAYINRAEGGLWLELREMPQGYPQHVRVRRCHSVEAAEAAIVKWVEEGIDPGDSLTRPPAGSTRTVTTGSPDAPKVTVSEVRKMFTPDKTRIKGHFPVTMRGGHVIWCSLKHWGDNEWVEAWGASTLGWGATPVAGGDTPQRALAELLAQLDAAPVVPDKTLPALMALRAEGNPAVYMIFKHGVLVGAIVKPVRPGDALEIPASDAAKGLYIQATYANMRDSDAKLMERLGQIVLAPIYDCWLDIPACAEDEGEEKAG